MVVVVDKYNITGKGGDVNGNYYTKPNLFFFGYGLWRIYTGGFV